MTNPKWEEQILVVKKDNVFAGPTPNYFYFQGLETNKFAVDSIANNLYDYLEVQRRGDKDDPTPKENNMEINEDYKQVIPYVIIKAGKKIFTYTRLDKGGEKRLHDAMSIGVGGHMNKPIGPVSNMFQIIMENMFRELKEELIIRHEFGFSPDYTFIGLINDDLDEVGKVHLGVLMAIDFGEDAIIDVRETDQLNGAFLYKENLMNTVIYNQLENWSKIALDAL